MPKIRVLDKQVAELIAAGEVVERPASVVKELAENALDAGAGALTVDIRGGGILFMRLTDDGCGIRREDVSTAFLRHATSKIIDKNDLDSIMTLGFRGEALASICAVAKVELLTRTETEDIGTRYLIEGGVETSLEDAGCPIGTTITVRDLFYNTPARMKFLHKDVYEANLVADVMERIALSHPEVAVTLIRDGKTVFSTPGDGQLMSAIYSVLGRTFAGGLIPVEDTLGGIHISGYVCKPVYCRPKRNGQYFFLNGRTIRCGTAVAALEAAYKNSAMVGRFPACVLQMELPAETVDVNVHPAKTEVRFSNDKPVFDAVYLAVKNALQKGDTLPNLLTKKPLKTSVFEHMTAEQYRQTVIGQEDVSPETPACAKPLVGRMNEGAVQSGGNKTGCAQKTAQAAGSKADDAVSVVAGEMAKEISKTPIKSGLEDKAILSATLPTQSQTVFRLNDYVPDLMPTMTVKKHRAVNVDIAVDEPILSVDREPRTGTSPSDKPLESTEAVLCEEKRYADTLSDDFSSLRYVGEAFKTYIIVEDGDRLYFIDKHAAHERILFEKLRRTQKPESQSLLLPVTVRLSAGEYAAVTAGQEALLKAGFELEDFGNETVLVRAVPAALTGEEAADMVAEVAANLCEQNSVSVSKMDQIYHTVACKAAIKAGYDTPKEEQLRLARDVLRRDDIRYCPHGRPVIFEMKKRDMEKQFGRIGS